MLEKISISELFGRFNYTIEMKPTGVTIITGPNGYGKSTILKIIEAVWQKNMCTLMYQNLKAFESECHLAILDC